MKVEYDKYYQDENLFGEPYPELLDFYAQIEQKGKLLDLGSGQGRDAIALARIGYDVSGIDYSEVGIKQLNKIAKQEDLNLTGIVTDIYSYKNFDQFEFILLDSMFHFGKKEKLKEIDLLNRIFEKAKTNALITICIQNAKSKLNILNDVISKENRLKTIDQIDLIYKYLDKKSNHCSETAYRMITVEKIK